MAHGPEFDATALGDPLLTWQLGAIEPEWTPCEDISFYHDFIPRFWEPGGSEVAMAPIHRFCTLARKMGVRSFHVEDARAMPGVADEIAHLQEFLPGVSGEVTATSITFLRSAAQAVDRSGDIADADVLSQMVVITFPQAASRTRAAPQNATSRTSFVFSAAARRCETSDTKSLLNNHVPVHRPQRIEIAGRTIEIPGTFFCQQNGVTSVCGHTAVRTLLMNGTGREITTSALNSEWGFGPNTRDLPATAVEDALRARGLNVVCYDLDTKKARPRTTLDDDGIWTVLTGLVESGTQTLLVMSTGAQVDHVVPLLGHTVNTDEWHPQGSGVHLNDQLGTTSSSLWIDHLVLNDDQLGPYYCLSRAGLFDKSGLAVAVKPRRVIAILPDQADLSPFAAETLARGAFARMLKVARDWRKDPPRWLDFLGTTKERRIFRTILMDRDSYAEWLRSEPAVACDELSIAVVEAVTSQLPPSFWMVEVSLPNIMLANKDKLGELLIPTTGGSQPSPVALRLPGVIGTIQAGDGKLFPFPIEGHVRMRSASDNDHQW